MKKERTTMRTSMRVAGCLACVLWVGVFSTGASAYKDSGSFCRPALAQDVQSAAKAQQGVKLIASRRHVEAGWLITARLLNFGHKSVGYGREFRIERYNASGWKLDPSSPDGPWVQSMGILLAGAAGDCYRFRVPVDQAKGRYRFSTRVSQRPGGEFVRTAEFRVQ